MNVMLAKFSDQRIKSFQYQEGLDIKMHVQRAADGYIKLTESEEKEGKKREVEKEEAKALHFLIKGTLRKLGYQKCFEAKFVRVLSLLLDSECRRAVAQSRKAPTMYVLTRVQVRVSRPCLPFLRGWRICNGLVLKGYNSDYFMGCSRISF